MGVARSDWPKWQCPVHRKPFLIDKEDILVCSGGDSFPRIKGIPRFVTTSNYADPFGAQWKKYRLTQLDSYTGTTISRDRARRCMGEELWGELEGKHILECGCGAGRFTEILLAKRALVTSIDLSAAVEANQESFPQNRIHRIAQADLLHLPFAPRQFDVVFCLGVIQHTPDPEETIALLYEQVRPGGTLVIDHYKYSLSWYTKSAPLFRWYFRRLPPDTGMRYVECLVNALWPLHQKARFRGASKLLSRLSPVLSYYHAYPDLNEDLQREWALLDTHDSLTDWYKHFRTQGQIRRTLDRLGLEQVACSYGGTGIEARGKRPYPRATLPEYYHTRAV
jgi:SAM-dependent methyltransferase